MRPLAAPALAVLILACGATAMPAGDEAPPPATTGSRAAVSTPDIQAVIDAAVAATVDAIAVRETLEAELPLPTSQRPTRAPLVGRGSKADMAPSETAPSSGADLPTVAPGPAAPALPSPTSGPRAEAAPTSAAGGVPAETPPVVPTAVPTETPTVVPTAGPTETSTPVPMPVQTETPTPVPMPVPTETPTPVPMPVPTETPTPVPMPVPTETPTPVPMPVLTKTPTPVPTPVPTETPTPVPTPLPTATRSPTPTPTVPPPNPSPALFLDVVGLTSPITRGSRATLEARTLSGARCSLRVTLPSGAVSGSSGTGAQPVAGGDGVVSWTWRVGGGTTPGVGKVRVECRLGGDRVEATRDLVIRAKS